MTQQNEQVRPLLLGVLTPDPLRMDGMKQMLEADDRFRLLSLAEALGGCAVALDLALLDIASTTHLESLVRQLRHARAEMGVLVMGPEQDAAGTMQIIRFGARGYLPYAASEKELRMALQVVHEGSIWAPRRVLARLLEQRAGETPAHPAVTRREQEVLNLLIQGHPNRRIAEALGLDEATVKAHLGGLMRKLGVGNRTALSMQAMAMKGRHFDIG